MAVKVIMPRQGQSVESCIMGEWYKQAGDRVAVGDVLFSYETDKASFEEEAKEAGTLLHILAETGDEVPVLETVAVIGEEGEEISALVNGQKAKITEEPMSELTKEQMPSAPEQVKIPTGLAVFDGGIKISPRAKGIADNQKLDIRQAAGTGPKGRIIERDIMELSRSGAQKDETAVTSVAEAGSSISVSEQVYEEIPLSNVRRMIAKSMHASLSEMAQLTHTSSFDAADILAYRKKLKEQGEALGLENITLNDIILYAVSRVLKQHKELNAHFLGDKIRYFQGVNLGMAVDTPRGLLVPTIFGADQMSLNEIAREAKRIASAAQDGKISPDELQGATFTISNLGAFGIEHFTPVINPPQTGILGVNNIQTRMKIADGQTAAYQAMGLSLTYDHRALDGAPASRFLQELCRTLESFSVLLAK